jgi:hypothetical protein
MIAIVVIGAAIATLVGTIGPAAGTPDPGPTLETLATGTTAVSYTQLPETTSTDSGVNEPVPFGESKRPAFNRTTSGTYAELLTRATLSTLTVDEQPVTTRGDDFRDAVDAATMATIGAQTQVVVLWQPYPNSHLRAKLTVGTTPPPDADLSAASTTVQSGMPSARDDARSAAETAGYSGVSRVVADRVVAGLFPPEQTALALRSGYPVAALTANRYYRVGDAYGVDLERPVRDRRPADANDRLASVLAGRIEADLRAEFDSPDAAARAIDADQIEIVVRRWA